MGVSLVAFVLLSLIERLNSNKLSLFSFYFYIGIFFEDLIVLLNISAFLDGLFFLCFICIL
jgi:hypothetical protein